MLFKVFCGRRGATRDHEPRRDEGSALPIRRGLAATRLETSSFARCTTEVESSRRWRRVPAAHSGSFAAPGHERRLRGTRKYTKSPSSPNPRKACSRGNVGRISIFHPCVLRLKTTRTTFSFAAHGALRHHSSDRLRQRPSVGGYASQFALCLRSPNLIASRQAYSCAAFLKPGAVASRWKELFYQLSWLFSLQRNLSSFTFTCAARAAGYKVNSRCFVLYHNKRRLSMPP